MSEAYIVAATMLPFSKYPDRSAAVLGRQVIHQLLDETGVKPAEIQAVYAGRSFAGALDGQVSVPGQTALRGTGISDLPVANFDNACAAVPTALHFASHALAGGQYETMLVVGLDKLFAKERSASMRALIGAMDVDEARWMLESDAVDGSVFMEHYYGKVAKDYMCRTGATARDLAEVAVKNRSHAGLNRFAQYRSPLTVEEVLAEPLVADPLTRLMCSPLTDGAVAMLLCSATAAKMYANLSPVRVAASVIRSGQPEATPQDPVLTRAAHQAFEEAGVGPDDLDFVEVHEASATGELIATEELGLCRPGEGARLLRDRDSYLGGRIPVNVSGGLLSRGHPGAATGGGQLVELVWQLQGHCGDRQVLNANVGLAHSSGGLIGREPGCTAVTILTH